MPLPRHAILREITDRSVLHVVLERRRITRADLAQATGISKPTISTAVERLETAGLLRATGMREGHRGRVATYYELAPTAGWVLALDVDADGVHARATDLAARVIDERYSPPVATGDVGAMVNAIQESVLRCVGALEPGNGPLRAVAMSVANAVRPDTSEILSLSDTPFPEGLLRPQEVFGGLVSAPVLVENDTNCAAHAERRSGAAAAVDNFAYLFVGACLGMGLYVDGRLVRGAHGTAGEVGYLAASTGAGKYSTLFAALGRQRFARSDSNAIDVSRLRLMFEAAASGDGGARATLTEFGTLVGQIVADTCAVVDPELVILGGPLGGDPALLPVVRATVATLAPSAVRIENGALGETASLHGAMQLAIDRALADIFETTPSAPV